MRRRSDYIGLLVIALSIGAVIGTALWGPHFDAPRVTCPSGYTLAGGGFAGVLHCVPGADPVYVRP